MKVKWWLFILVCTEYVNGKGELCTDTLLFLLLSHFVCQSSNSFECTLEDSTALNSGLLGWNFCLDFWHDEGTSSWWSKSAPAAEEMMLKWAMENWNKAPIEKAWSGKRFSAEQWWVQLARVHCHKVSIVGCRWTSMLDCIFVLMLDGKPF